MHFCQCGKNVGVIEYTYGSARCPNAYRRLSIVDWDGSDEYSALVEGCFWPDVDGVLRYLAECSEQPAHRMNGEKIIYRVERTGELNINSACVFRFVGVVGMLPTLQPRVYTLDDLKALYWPHPSCYEDRKPLPEPVTAPPCSRLELLFGEDDADTGPDGAAA